MCIPSAYVSPNIFRRAIATAAAAAFAQWHGTRARALTHTLSGNLNPWLRAGGSIRSEKCDDDGEEPLVRRFMVVAALMLCRCTSRSIFRPTKRREARLEFYVLENMLFALNLTHARKYIRARCTRDFGAETYPTIANSLFSAMEDTSSSLRKVNGGRYQFVFRLIIPM